MANGDFSSLPLPGKQRATFSPVPVPPPDWWAEALIPLD